MRTEAEIEKCMSKEFLLFYFPFVFFLGVAAAFFIDGFWWRGAVAVLVANVFSVIGGLRRSLLARELRLAKLGLSE